MTNVLCAMCRTVFGFVVWFFFSFHAQMYWDACIRSPYTCFVMSSFKGLLSHSVRAFLSNSTDTEKATAWSHNNSIVNTSKSSANALAGWHREEPHEHICTTYQYMRKKTIFFSVFAQRIVISENLQDNEKKKTKNREKEQTNGDNYYVLCARRAKQ